MPKNFSSSNTSLFVGLILIVSLTIFSCKKEEVSPLTPIETALDRFVATLVSTPATSADLSDRIKNYMMAQPKTFYGSTVALLDNAGKVTISPYWYRSNNTLAFTELTADSTYRINTLEWLRKPIDGGKAIWTAPYFDAGGGNIWMRTRSVPVFVNGKIIAVATTDMEVANPN
jgi:phosphoserine phosphatase RsbU/P